LNIKQSGDLSFEESSKNSKEDDLEFENVIHGPELAQEDLLDSDFDQFDEMEHLNSHKISLELANPLKDAIESNKSS
jgi:hypothetical protein